MTTTTANAGPLRIGLVQMTATRDIDENVAAACGMIREAAAKGARYVQTPEVTTQMELDRERLFALIEPEQGNACLLYTSRCV